MKTQLPTSTAEVLNYARRLGWSYRRTKVGWWLTHPDGGMTSFHDSPCSDRRAWRNIVARLQHTKGDR